MKVINIEISQCKSPNSQADAFSTIVLQGSPAAR